MADIDNDPEQRMEDLMNDIIERDKAHIKHDELMIANYTTTVDKFKLISTKLGIAKMRLADLHQGLTWLPDGTFRLNGKKMALNAVVTRWGKSKVSAAMCVEIDKIRVRVQAETKAINNVTNMLTNMVREGQTVRPD